MEFGVNFSVFSENTYRICQSIAKYVLRNVNVNVFRLLLGPAKYFWETSSLVFHIAQDARFKNNLIFSEAHHLKTVNKKGTMVTWLVGRDEGYANGIGKNARFRWLTGFLQLNSTHSILVDKYNHCLRWLERANNYVADYVGECENPGNSDGIGSAATLTNPSSLTRDANNDNRVFIAVKSERDAIRILYLDTRKVETLDSSSSKPIFQDGVYAIVKDTSNAKAVLMTGNSSIARFQFPDSVTRISGAAESGFQDGTLENALFNGTSSIVAIRRGVYIVADSENHRLRVVDLVSGKVSSICSGIAGYKPGTVAECNLDRPYALFYLEDTLYVGATERIVKMEG